MSTALELYYWRCYQDVVPWTGTALLGSKIWLSGQDLVLLAGESMSASWIAGWERSIHLSLPKKPPFLHFNAYPQRRSTGQLWIRWFLHWKSFRMLKNLSEVSNQKRGQAAKASTTTLIGPGQEVWKSPGLGRLLIPGPLLPLSILNRGVLISLVFNKWAYEKKHGNKMQGCVLSYVYCTVLL